MLPFVLATIDSLAEISHGNHLGAVVMFLERVQITQVAALSAR